MACVISISSDEDEVNESIENPRKKRKTEQIIYLDLEDDKITKKKKYDNKVEDIIIESDEDAHCSDNNLSTKIRSLNVDEDLSNSDVESNHHERLAKKCNNNKLLTTKLVSKIIINNEDIIESEQDATLLTKSTSSITTDNIPKNNHKKYNFSKNEGVSTSKQQDDRETFKNCEKMQLFISVCLSQIESEQTKDLFNSKVPFCEKLFTKVDSEYIQSEYFLGFLEEKINESRESSLKAVSSFNDVYCHLKSKVRQQKSDIETTSKHHVIIAKLEHALRKVHKKIIQLEEEEVDFNEEEDSSYLKMHRYRERAVNLHKKICKYKNEDANANNILYNRLDFAGSKYPEFNHAINKKFRNNSAFPSYYELEQCLKKAVNDKNMNLPDIKLKQEARDCFKNLGNLLQKRRKLDLLNIHSHYLVTNDDPAGQDRELDAKLSASSKEAKTKIDEICEKYVKLQESGENPQLSSDSDDSKRASTDDEDDCK